MSEYHENEHQNEINYEFRNSKVDELVRDPSLVPSRTRSKYTSYEVKPRETRQLMIDDVIANDHVIAKPREIKTVVFSILLSFGLATGHVAYVKANNDRKEEFNIGRDDKYTATPIIHRVAK